MKYIYVENYLFVPREKKFEFLKFLHSFKRFKLKNQKIVLNDNSLIVELSEDSSRSIAKKCIDMFFKNDNTIRTFFVERILIEENVLSIFFNQNDVKKVKL